MPLRATILMFAWLVSNDIWAVYGVMAEPQVSCVECTTISSSISFSTTPSLTDPREPYITVASSSEPPFPPAILVETETPPAPVANPSVGLSKGAKIGIGVGVGLFGAGLAVVAVLNACYLRRKRREKAMLNAIEEVERGAKESQERIVLESRVSIVFDDGASAVEVDENGRNGLSLPRREY